MLWKGYQNFDFSQNVEDIIGKKRQRTRDGILEIFNTMATDK